MEQPTAKETARDVFLHLLSAAMLYLSMIGFIMLWWQIINFLFPDKLNVIGRGSQIYMTLIRGTSMLAVAFPVFVLLSWIIGRDLRVNPSKREAGVRKWLWYITLFVSAMTIIIDLVILIFNFLRGDLTTQFFLKLIVILAVGAAVFGYYLWDLRKREKPTDVPKKLAWISAAVILVSIIYGFFLVGSPAKQRNLRFDEQRVMNLQAIISSVANYWQQKNQLPASLSDLSVLGFNVPKDPETEALYEYSVPGNLTFRLCATFKLSAAAVSGSSEMYYEGPYYPSQVGVATTPQNWEHGAGRTCFDTTIDPAFFTKTPAPEKVLPPPATVPAD
jgi:hypothetical protein